MQNKFEIYHSLCSNDNKKLSLVWLTRCEHVVFFGTHSEMACGWEAHFGVRSEIIR